MKFELRVWRQDGPEETGRLESYSIDGIEGDMSFLEMLDVANEQLAEQGIRPIEFDYDCREGICGSCSLVIDGEPHGPRVGTTTCQTYMRHYEDGQAITIEPWRARAFPVIRDLVVDRGALDRIVEAVSYTHLRAHETRR